MTMFRFPSLELWSLFFTHTWEAIPDTHTDTHTPIDTHTYTRTAGIFWSLWDTWLTRDRCFSETGAAVSITKPHSSVTTGFERKHLYIFTTMFWILQLLLYGWIQGTSIGSCGSWFKIQMCSVGLCRGVYCQCHIAMWKLDIFQKWFKVLCILPRVTASKQGCFLCTYKV